MKDIKSRNLFYYWMIFVISPFLAFILVLKRGFNKYYQPVILAFAFLYGFHVFTYSGDILRYAETYQVIRTYSWNDFWYLLINRLDPEALSRYPENVVNRKPDIFAFSLQFLTSRVSDSPRLFWGLVSLINTKFMLMFFNRVYRHLDVKPKTILHYTFIAFLVLVVPFYVGVSGVRFWPALFLFLYFLLHYIDKKKIKWLFLGGFFSILIHYTFFIPFIIILLFHYTSLGKKSSKFLVILALLYFGTSSTTSMFQSFQTAVKITEGTTVSESMGTYADQDLLEHKTSLQDKQNWYVSLRSQLLFYFLILFTILEVFGFIKLRDNIYSEKLYPYLIIFFCLAMLTYQLGSLGRFVYIFYLLAFSRYVIIFPNNTYNYHLKGFSLTLIPVLILYTAVTFRAGFYTVDSYFLVNNSVSLFFLRSTESLSEFLVGH